LPGVLLVVALLPLLHGSGSARLVILERQVGPDLGSDHRPLSLTVAWSGQT